MWPPAALVGQERGLGLTKGRWNRETRVSSWVLREHEAGRRRDRLEEWKTNPRTEERTEERHQDSHMLNAETDEDKVGMRSEGPNLCWDVRTKASMWQSKAQTPGS